MVNKMGYIYAVGYYWAIKIHSDLNLSTGLGRSPGEGKGYPLQYPGLENSMDCIVHGVEKRWTHPSNFHFLSNTWFKNFPGSPVVKIPCLYCREWGFDPWSRELMSCMLHSVAKEKKASPLIHHPKHVWGFHGGSDSKGSVCSAGNQSSIPRVGRSPGEGNGNPL